MGEELGAWFSRYLGKDGLRVYYMSPLHRPRVLMDDSKYSDFSHPGDEVSTIINNFLYVPLEKLAIITLIHEKVIPSQ